MNYLNHTYYIIIQFLVSDGYQSSQSHPEIQSYGKLIFILILQI